MEREALDSVSVKTKVVDDPGGGDDDDDDDDDVGE